MANTTSAAAPKLKKGYREANVMQAVKAKQGRLVKVVNKNRTFGSAIEYVAVWVEDANGKRERCLLFSQNEIEVAQLRAAKNKEDLTKKSWITDAVD
jgi:hypothetical protein